MREAAKAIKARREQGAATATKVVQVAQALQEQQAAKETKVVQVVQALREQRAARGTKVVQAVQAAQELRDQAPKATKDRRGLGAREALGTRSV